MEISRSPNRITARVLGMGVAVITRTLGSFPFLVRRFLCSTPNLCCSSVTTSPRSANSTSGWIMAWVPTRICIFPSFRSSSSSLRSLTFMLPDSSSQRTPRGSKSFFKVSICCLASNSVGAIMTAWKPHFTVLYIASSATTVLPDPTSPCTSLFMGLESSRSASISLYALFWPSVSSNLILFRNSSTPTFLSSFIPFWKDFMPFLI